MATEELTDIERWFLARGIPHFIADYNTSTRVWTRAIPFLLVTYLLAAVPFTADSWREAGVELAISLTSLVAAWVISNIARSRPAFSRPRHVGPVELGVYVFGPALGHLVAGEGTAAVVAVVIQLLLLGVAYVVTSYALIPMSQWTFKRSIDSFRVVGAAMARALPLLLLVVMFFFLTTEVWQVFARLEGLPYALALLLFLFSGSAFAANRARADLDDVPRVDDWEELHEVVQGTPAEHLAANVAVRRPLDDDELTLSRRQRINLLLVIVINQVLLSLVVAGAIFLFFIVFGFLGMSREVIEVWVLHPPNALFSLTISGHTMIVSEELIRVSGFLATFSGFYFGVYSATDATLREGLGEFAEANLRQLFAVRQLYLAGRTQRSQ